MSGRALTFEGFHIHMSLVLSVTKIFGIIYSKVLQKVSDNPENCEVHNAAKLLSYMLVNFEASLTLGSLRISDCRSKTKCIRPWPREFDVQWIFKSQNGKVKRIKN
jgi:hypothetical protein